jgi:hypothetical protein
MATMMLAKSMSEARVNRTHRLHPDGRETWISRFFTASAEAPEQPVAFYVEKKAYAVIPPHFHAVNQFQVIAAGSGTLGKQAVEPLTLHYTNGYTGYGPICAGEEGIAFFTLRNRFDAGGARFFPGGRSFMKPAPKRHCVSGPLTLSSAAHLQSREDQALETIIEPEADGLAAWFLRVAPSTTTYTPAAEQGGGQYIIVAGGSWLCDGVELPRLSCAYVSADAGPIALQAGPHGLETLVVQFPSTEAYVAGKTHI